MTVRRKETVTGDLAVSVQLGPAWAKVFLRVSTDVS